VLIAFSENFASITGLEYAFTKAPTNMRSLVMSMFLFTSATSAVCYQVHEQMSQAQGHMKVWLRSLGLIGGVVKNTALVAEGNRMVVQLK
jgi:dipeptide/tripeptide permease